MKSLYLLVISIFFCLSPILAQGDLCVSAVILPGTGTYSANGPSTGGGCFNCGSSTNADWYSFTAPSNGVIDIATCFGGADTRFWVYDGSCATLNQVAAADDECDMGTGSLWASEALGIPVTMGTTYYIEFDDRWSGSGFTWNFTFSPAPGSCAAPSGLAATNISSTAASLNWTENGSATTWKIEWGTTGFIQGTGSSAVTTAIPLNLTTLTAITSYDFYVRAICGPGDTSLSNGAFNFTTLAVGINDFSSIVGFNLYPNPSSGVFTLKINTRGSNGLKIRIENTKGQIVYFRNDFDNVSTIHDKIDLSNNAKGIYFLHVLSNGESETHKLVIK